MSDLVRLSQAVGKGRRGWAERLTREKILEALLRKRAEAHRHGLSDEERMLREQILWSLPIQAPADAPEASETAGKDASATIP